MSKHHDILQKAYLDRLDQTDLESHMPRSILNEYAHIFAYMLPNERQLSTLISKLSSFAKTHTVNYNAVSEGMACYRSLLKQTQDDPKKPATERFVKLPTVDPTVKQLLLVGYPRPMNTKGWDILIEGLMAYDFETVATLTPEDNRKFNKQLLLDHTITLLKDLDAGEHTKAVIYNPGKDYTDNANQRIRMFNVPGGLVIKTQSQELF